MEQALQNVHDLYMKGIRDGDYEFAVNEYTGDYYKQHSTGVADGVDGFITFFKPFTEAHPDRKIDLVRSWQDGKHVFVQAYQALDGDTVHWVTADFFDTDDNSKVIEHWDCIEPYNESNASGQDNVHGTSEFEDLDKTEENKAAILSFFEKCMGETPATMEGLVAIDLVEHSATVGLLGVVAEKKFDAPFLITGHGNFVSTLSKAVTRADGEDYAHIDVFRLKDGIIVEHWAVIEKCEPVEQRVNSGKF